MAFSPLLFIKFDLKTCWLAAAGRVTGGAGGLGGPGDGAGRSLALLRYTTLQQTTCLDFVRFILSDSITV